MTLKISVFIRTKNNDWVISQTLNALFSQTLKPDELVVVDSGSTDKTLDILKEFDISPLQISPDSYIPGKVINETLEKISSDIVIMLNSDSVLLSKDSLNNLIAPFNDPNVVATVGRQIPRHDAEDWVRRDYDVAFPEQGPIPDFIGLSFPLSAFRLDAWKKEKFYTKSWGSEDTEWGKRIVRNGLGTIEYVPTAITMHSHNYNFSQLFARRFIEGEADFFINGNIPNLFISYVKSCGREFKYYTKKGNYLGIPKIFIRNLYSNWGYFKGFQSAKRRVKNNDTNLVAKNYQ